MRFNKAILIIVLLVLLVTVAGIIGIILAIVNDTLNDSHISIIITGFFSIVGMAVGWTLNSADKFARIEPLDSLLNKAEFTKDVAIPIKESLKEPNIFKNKAKVRKKRRKFANKSCKAAPLSLEYCVELYNPSSTKNFMRNLSVSIEGKVFKMIIPNNKEVKVNQGPSEESNDFDINGNDRLKCKICMTISPAWDILELKKIHYRYKKVYLEYEDRSGKRPLIRKKIKLGPLYEVMAKLQENEDVKNGTC